MKKRNISVLQKKIPNIYAIGILITGGVAAYLLVVQPTAEIRSQAAGHANPRSIKSCGDNGGTCMPTAKCKSRNLYDLGKYSCVGNLTCCSENPSPTPLPTTDKRVFLTSATYSGDLGGLSGADAKCQTRADAAHLGGTWKAWISDSNTDAGSRVTHTNGQYILLNGTVVADNWDDLTDGTIQHPITINEFGTSPTYQSCVWTSTNTDGTGYVPVGNITLCNNYTAADGNYSMCGHNGATGTEWTNWSSDRCDMLHPIYCFEQ